MQERRRLMQDGSLHGEGSPPYANAAHIFDDMCEKKRVHTKRSCFHLSAWPRPGRQDCHLQPACPCYGHGNGPGLELQCCSEGEAAGESSKNMGRRAMSCCWVEISSMTMG